MQPGQIFEKRYRLQREIGRGSFGTVYLAEDLETRQFYAIKVLLPWTKGNPRMQHRLRREAKLTQMLKSQHAIRIAHLGETSGGDLYIVMEYLRGHELTEVLRQEGRLPPDRVASIARQVLEAVGEAHALGVIHRDLKPHNIFLCHDAQQREIVKVLDFGIAKLAGTEGGTGLMETTRLTDPGGVLGTPAYMSPEQCRGEDYTPASDFYSLGVMMYEMLTGRVPFLDENPVQIMVMHNTQKVPPLNETLADSQIGKAVMRSLEKDRSARFSSAEQFAAAIEGRTYVPPAAAPSPPAVAGAPPQLISKRHAPAETPAPPHRRRSLWSKLWVPLLILVLVGVAVASWVFNL